MHNNVCFKERYFKTGGSRWEEYLNFGPHRAGSQIVDLSSCARERVGEGAPEAAAASPKVLSSLSSSIWLSFMSWVCSFLSLLLLLSLLGFL